MAGENDFAQGAPEIVFQVNGQTADQKYSYQPGSSTVLNLTIGGTPALSQPVQSPVDGSGSATPVVVAQVSDNTSTQSYTVPVQQVQAQVFQNESVTTLVQ